MDVEAFAARLIAARQSGDRIATLKPSEAPESAAEAYAVQDAILRRLGIGIAGWKVGAATPTALPQAGPILADRCQAVVVLNDRVRRAVAAMAWSLIVTS